MKFEMEKKFNRILSLLLALIMVIGFVPMSHAHAEGEETTTPDATKYRWEMIEDETGAYALHRVTGEGKEKLDPAGGTIGANGKVGQAYYNIGETIKLNRTDAWSIEWEGSGSKYFLLSNKTEGYTSASHQGIYRNNTVLGVHYRLDSNNAFAQMQDGLTGFTDNHLFLIKNDPAKSAEETNHVYLYIDGVKAGELNSTDYLQKNDLAFTYIGNSGLSGANLVLKHLEISIPHTHSYTIKGKSVDGDCQTSGYDVMLCACGDEQKVETGVYGDHSYGAWVKDGNVFSRTCSVCEDEQVSNIFRWEMSEVDGAKAFVSAEGYTPNPLTSMNASGSISEDGTMTSMSYSLANAVTLKAAEEWSVKWETNGRINGMLLSRVSPYGNNNIYLWLKDSDTETLEIGNYGKTVSGNTHNWLAVDASSDPNVKNLYYMYNTVSTNEDGTVSNVIKLNVNGSEYVINETAAGVVKKNYQSGWDIIVGYIGAGNSYYINGKLNYLEIAIPHTHEYNIEKETVVGKDCQTSGYDVMACECGATTNVDNGIKGTHTYSEWKADNGVMTRNCTACGDALQTATYVWEKRPDETENFVIYDVVKDDNVTKGNGAAIDENGKFSNYYATFAEPVTLNFDDAWAIEWKATGAMSKGMFLSKKADNANGNQYLYSTGTYLVFGKRQSSKHDNAPGVAINSYTGTHTYRIVNEVTTDENGAYVTNTPYLWIDGVKIDSPMSGLTTEYNDVYPAGVNLEFGGISNSGYKLSNYALDYLTIYIPTSEEDYTCEFGEWTETDGQWTRKCECGKTETAVAIMGMDTPSASLSDLLAAAESDSEITLLDDAKVEDLLLSKGIALDLNGKTLEVTGAVIVDNGNNIYDRTNGKGLLKTTGDVQFPTNNWALPVPVDGGYILVMCDNFNETNKGSLENNTYAYYFLPYMPADAHDAIVAACGDSNVQLKVDLSWTKENEAYGITVNYPDDLIEKFYEGYADGKYQYAFKLGLTGTVGIEDLDFNVYFESCGVKLPCVSAEE